MSNVLFNFWNVGHGHATYLRTPNDRHIVIDLGIGKIGEDDEFSPLNLLESRHYIFQLDYVIITHPHVDHIADILRLSNFKPKVLTRPIHLDLKPILEKANDDQKPIINKYIEINDLYKTPIPETSFDYLGNPRNWGGLKINSFMPNLCSQSNINNHSVVTVFEFENIKVLIPGDNECPSWEELWKMDSFEDISRDIDVLLAPHHGRDSGFHNDIMKHMNPRLTIISDGASGDTSVTSKYSEISRGCNINKANGETEKRCCLTTRKDGYINLSFGTDFRGSRFFSVNTGN